MAIISKPNATTNGTTADGAKVSANFDTIYSDYNGNITDANIAASGITTYGKVNGAALSALGSINAGAGTIPVANIPTGTTANKVVVLDGSAKLPAVDGSQLTGLSTAALGSWASKSNNTAYQAATDGFVLGYCGYSDGGAGTLIQGITDSNASPSAVRIESYAHNASTINGGIMMPVKKNDYWKTVGCLTAVYWIPMGS